MLLLRAIPEAGFIHGHHSAGGRGVPQSPRYSVGLARASTWRAARLMACGWLTSRAAPAPGGWIRGALALTVAGGATTGGRVVVVAHYDQATAVSKVSAADLVFVVDPFNGGSCGQHAGSGPQPPDLSRGSFRAAGSGCGSGRDR